LWDEEVVKGLPWLVAEDAAVHEALEVLRLQLCFPYWRRKVGRDFLDWFKVEARRMDPVERRRTIDDAGGEAPRYAAKASWWKWDGGHFAFFWRWPVEFQREIRDGVKQRFSSDPRTARS
jgi:hypothetical protein